MLRNETFDMRSANETLRTYIIYQGENNVPRLFLVTLFSQ